MCILNIPDRPVKRLQKQNRADQLFKMGNCRRRLQSPNFSVLRAIGDWSRLLQLSRLQQLIGPGEQGERPAIRSWFRLQAAIFHVRPLEGGTTDNGNGRWTAAVLSCVAGPCGLHSGKDGGNLMSRRRKQVGPAKPHTREPYVPLVVCLVLVAAVFIVFGQTLSHDFVNYDDIEYVCDNYHVTQGLSWRAIGWAIATDYAGNWHPITWLSHCLDCQFHDLRPAGHHLTNILLHAANAVLLFLVLRRMTDDLWPSALVAALFAIHPLRVESVAWVAERKDLLAGLFFMLTLAAYLHFVRRSFSPGRYLTVLVVFASGLMSKPMLVTVPFVLLLLDYWPLGRLRPPASERPTSSILLRLIIEKIPLLLLTAVSCVVTLLVQTESIAKADRLPLDSRLPNAAVASVSYLGQFFWPANLAVFYPHPGDGLPTQKVIGSLLVLLGISAGALACWRRIPAVAVGWLWYLGMLAPVIGLVQVGQQSQADRYTYLPQIGLSITLAWGAMHAARSWPYRRQVFGVASALAIVVLMGCAWHQTTFWRDSQSLWNRDLACTTRNSVAHTNLGAVLTTLERYDDAVDHLKEALAIQPGNLDAHVDLGEALAKLKQYEAARQQYEAALKIDPNCVEAHYNLAIAWVHLGNLDEAIREYEATLKINPDCAEAHGSLAGALQYRGQSDQAIEHYEKAVILATRQNKPSLAAEAQARLRQIAERESAP
jgi:protein O-mannosyl-transferase